MLDAINPATGALVQQYPTMTEPAVHDVLERVADAYRE